jgi:hypothetical protein
MSKHKCNHDHVFISRTRNLVQNLVVKLTLYMFYKTMSFLILTDPVKRDFLVQNLIDTCKAIMQESFNERLGDAKLYQDSTKLFKPLTEKVELSAKVLEPSIKDIASTVKALPSTLTESINAVTPAVRPLAPQCPSIEAIETAPQQPPIELGEIATAYLKRFAEQANTIDKTFGIHDRGGKFYVGNTEVMLDGNNITLMGAGNSKTYICTPGLWELIVSKQPASDTYSLGKLENYQEIVINISALKRMRSILNLVRALNG